jgi:hypothetical protein
MHRRNNVAVLVLFLLTALFLPRVGFISALPLARHVPQGLKPAFSQVVNGTAEQAAGKVDFRRPAPKGASDCAELTVSLRRYPDTKLSFSAAFEAMAYPKSIEEASSSSHGQAGAPNQPPAAPVPSSAPLAPLSGVQSTLGNPAPPAASAGQGVGPNAAQEPESENGTFVFHKQVEEVVLHATVVDDKQRIVTSLDKGDFNVYEDGHPQTITSFRHEDIPVAMGIVVDNSGSMREKRQKVNAAALNLVLY